MKFKRKNLVVDAIELTADSFYEVEMFLGYQGSNHRMYVNEQDFLRKTNPVGIFVKTQEGDLLAKVGYWITKDEFGNIDTHKPALFYLTHEEA
jgi:hypothetical protein